MKKILKIVVLALLVGYATFSHTSDLTRAARLEQENASLAQQISELHGQLGLVLPGWLDIPNTFIASSTASLVLVILTNCQLRRCSPANATVAASGRRSVPPNPARGRQAAEDFLTTTLSLSGDTIH